jgi:integrase
VRPSPSARLTACCPPAGSAGSTWPPPSPTPGPSGPTTGPAGRNAASSTARPARPVPSPSRRPWSRCSAPTPPATAPPPTGRLFRTARGAPLNDTGYGQVWQRARPAALTTAQQASPLARRPYDLRHAAVSLWLNAGVPAPEVARRAGHGVAVLLRVYANCIDGQAAAANQRISDALDERDDEGR